MLGHGPSQELELSWGLPSESKSAVSAATCCVPECISAGIWSQKQSQELSQALEHGTLAFHVAT